MGMKPIENENKQIAEKKAEISKKMEWNEFLEELSDAVDEDIIRYRKESNRKFIGGKCHITSEEKGIFLKSLYLVIEAVLYFEGDNQEEAEKRTITRKCSYAEFADEAATRKQLESIMKNPYVMEITEPVIDETEEEMV